MKTKAAACKALSSEQQPALLVSRYGSKWGCLSVCLPMLVDTYTAPLLMGLSQQQEEEATHRRAGAEPPDNKGFPKEILEQLCLQRTMKVEKARSALLGPHPLSLFSSSPEIISTVRPSGT